MAVEESVRQSAQKFSNAYILCIFACCREILLRQTHSGGITLEEAKKKKRDYEYEKLKREEKLIMKLKEPLAIRFQ